MPYSEVRKVAMKREREWQKQRNKFEKEVDRFLHTVANKTVNTLTKEMDKMFNAYMTCYYRNYATKKYIRHDEPGVGTRHGSNLFEANNIGVQEIGLGYQGFDINVNSSRMQNYPKHGKGWGKAKILNSILDRYRWLGGNRWEQFSWSYKGKYFSVKDMAWEDAVLDAVENQNVISDLLLQYTKQQLSTSKYPMLNNFRKSRRR